MAYYTRVARKFDERCQEQFYFGEWHVVRNEPDGAVESAIDRSGYGIELMRPSSGDSLCE